MKKLLRETGLTALSAATMVIFAVFATSCSKEVETNPRFENPMDLVGEFHNKALKYVLREFLNSKEELVTFQDSVLKISSLIAEYRQKIPSENLLMSEFIDYKEIDLKVTNRFIERHLNKGDSVLGYYSETARGYFYEINNLFEGKNVADSIEVFEMVSELERQIFASKMSDSEKGDLLIASAVGKYSWKFWSLEFPTLSKSEEDWRDKVIRADMVGALAGAIWGCFQGALVGTVILPGVGTLTACIVQAMGEGFVGAVLASTIEGLFCLIFD